MIVINDGIAHFQEKRMRCEPEKPETWDIIP